MGYRIYPCKAYNADRANGNLIFWSNGGNYPISFLKDGYLNSTYSTNNSTVRYSHSCAHSTWSRNTRTYRITMDNVLRNAITSVINSGGLVNLQNYLSNLDVFKAYDMNGNNSIQVYGYVCIGSSKTGNFDVTQIGSWDGSWPKNFPTSLTYSYNIPSVGTVSDTIMLITEGWYSKTNQRRTHTSYTAALANQYSESQILSPPSSSNWINGSAPFRSSSSLAASTWSGTIAHYTIDGIYSRNAGTRGMYSDNAADVILNSGSNYFSGLNKNVLMQLVSGLNGQTNLGNCPSITNNIIMAITDVDFVNNVIQVTFALSHDRDHSMVAFCNDHQTSLSAVRMHYNFPVTNVHRVTDSWSVQFINKSDFDPQEPNGNGPSTLVWDSANHAIVLTAGNHVANAHGFSKIISGSQGVLNCSCSNVNGTIRFTLAGYSITIPSGITSFDVRIMALNGNNIGYWRISPPSAGLSHSFTITYPSTVNAPISSFNNELYTALIQAFSQPSLPFIFEVAVVNQEYTINISGLVRVDVVSKNGKTYHSVSIYDINGDFSRLLVKNGVYVTMPITITVDIQVVNNTILVKAGYASIGFTSTSIGDIIVDTDAVAVLLPAVASVSKNGARIGYATTTVNQSSFAFSFSAAKDEVEQTDDFVSHYLQ